MQEKIDWEKHRIKRWAAGHHVALSPCLVPIAAGAGRMRTKDQAIAMGCHTPMVVRADQVRMRDEDREHNCSCHDQFGNPI